MSAKTGMSETVINQLTDVIAEIVAKTVDEAIDKRLSANGTLIQNRKPGQGFKLPKAEGYKAPEGE